MNRFRDRIQYFKKYFSPWVLFYSGDFDSLESSLEKVFQKFLDTYWNIYSENFDKYKNLSYNEIRSLHRRRKDVSYEARW